MCSVWGMGREVLSRHGFFVFICVSRVEQSSRDVRMDYQTQSYLQRDAGAPGRHRVDRREGAIRWPRVHSSKNPHLFHFPSPPLELEFGFAPVEQTPITGCGKNSQLQCFFPLFCVCPIPKATHGKFWEFSFTKQFWNRTYFAHVKIWRWEIKEQLLPQRKQRHER